jgi:hypothetical protein
MASGRGSGHYYNYLFQALCVLVVASCSLTSNPNPTKPVISYYYSIMADTTKFYYSLPTQAPQTQRSGSRRPPLTPSTVSSPCLTTHAPIASRRDSGSGSPTKASTLLAKVASHPTSPKGETPTASPLPSPTTQAAEMHSSPMCSQERPAVWRSESARYVGQYRQQGKHYRQHIKAYRSLTFSQMATLAFPTLRNSARTRILMTAITGSTLRSRHD